MARVKTRAGRIKKARALIKEAHDLPLPPGTGKFDFSYIAQVKDLLRQARDLVKFIPNDPNASEEELEEVKKIFEEAEQANKDILR